MKGVARLWLCAVQCEGGAPHKGLVGVRSEVGSGMLHWRRWGQVEGNSNGGERRTASGQMEGKLGSCQQ